MKEAENALKRVMDLETYIVSFEFPNEIFFHSNIPFDLKIEDGNGTAMVLAANQQEAESIVQEYFDGSAAYWDMTWLLDDDDLEDAE